MSRKFTPILILWFALISQNIFSQNVVVSGQLLDSEGQPIVGATVMIKGATIGTVTDLDGYYSLEAPLNATLVFNFIGYTSREVKVAALVKKEPANDYKKVAPLNPDIVEKYFNPSDKTDKVSGVYNLTNNTERNKKILKKYDPWNYFRVYDRYNYTSKTRFRVELLSSLMINQVSKLPERQSEFVQGRNISGELHWSGPENNEVFSWGPTIKTLEYSRNSYPYDKNGEIVVKGKGNGKSVLNYNPADFYRTGLSNQQTVIIGCSDNRTNFDFTWHYTKENGVIPNSYLIKNNYNFILETRIGRDFTIKAKLLALEANANLLSGFGQSRIIQSLFQTPISFDNSNRMSSSAAIKDSSSYMLPDGTNRSFAPTSAYNPYWLINNLIDTEKSKWLLAGLQMTYNFHKGLNGNLEGSIEKQVAKDHYGFKNNILQLEQPAETSRISVGKSAYAKLGIIYDKSYDHWNLNMGISYEIDLLKNSLERSDFELTDTLIKRSTSRIVHSIVPKIDVEYYNAIKGDLSAKVLSSSTLNKTFVKPTIGLAIYPFEIFDYYFDVISYMKIFSSYNTGLNEAPIYLKRGQFNSISKNSSEFLNYYETIELQNNNDLSPEETNRWDAGIYFGMFYNRIIGEFSFYKGGTTQLIVPELIVDHFSFSNGGDLITKGIDLSLSFKNFTYNSFNVTNTLSFSKNFTTVKNIERPDGTVIIGGFSDVSIALVNNEPYGVIIGNTYKYNENGHMIIGYDGYPIVDTIKKVIGNPNPDWIMGWSTQLSYKGIDFTFTFDWKKGGQIWNGTKNNLSYLGLSKVPGDQRNTSSYLYEGVHPDGSPNITPVSFYNPDQPLNENRWVRYGPTGVASDAIEDGSWLRLSELIIAYQLNSQKLFSGNIPKIRISIFANNLFVITRYSGVDPQTKLLGFNNNFGLDYYNSPGFKTFGATLQLIF